jgi:ribosomal protein S18 acetylase RimI-like enzyme
MHITAASSDHLRDVAAVHVASWQEAYRSLLPSDYLAKLSVEKREAAWRQVLAEGRSELLVAVEGDRVVGFVSFGPCRDQAAPPDRGEVWAIYVAPRAWSTGVGQALWRAASERLKTLGFLSVSLWVIEGNERARRFYWAAGFNVEAGSEKEFELGGARLREVRMVALLHPQYCVPP